ncbi:hypothetical protein QTP70_006773 [Hemibagrus guttatus]|uniref:Uncharacterized protein n=1 Tax=Hemibagrus guttatus TaxID=175788 RepID=A0AAE0QVI8_9TELE|nr:hypothetical protein QTP70_006773 [Hemibagrus guttatus]
MRRARMTEDYKYRRRLALSEVLKENNIAMMRQNLQVDVLEAGKMDKRKDLGEFDKGQIVMARPLDQSISKTAALLGCSRSAVVSIYQKWSKEGTVVNRRQGHGRPRLIDGHGERRLGRVVRSNR